MKPFTFLVLILLGVAIFTAPITAHNPAEAAATTEISRTSVTDTPFADVPPQHWAAEAVKKLAELGIILGYPAPQNPQNSSMANRVQEK